jgi:predicted RNA-binding protein with RPS1 domain
MKQRYMQIKGSGAILLSLQTVEILLAFYDRVKDMPNCKEIDGYKTLSSIMEKWREKHMGVCEFCEKEMPLPGKVGKRKRFCSDNCRATAYRLIKKAENDPSLSFEDLKKKHLERPKFQGTVRERSFNRTLKELERLSEEDKDRLRRNLL